MISTIIGGHSNLVALRVAILVQSCCSDTFPILVLSRDRFATKSSTELYQKTYA